MKLLERETNPPIPVISKGKQYRSKLERQIALQLREAGVRFEYESMRLGYTRKCTYTPDFILSNGILIEVKGWFKSSDRTKMVAVREANPELDIRFLFQNANIRITKGSKTSYGDWAEKKGFKWAEKRVPESWLSQTL